MEKQTVTIYDVAERAGVSMATVSRVVNGNQNVKPATRKKVMEVIEELDYRPNAVARGLASKRTTTIGVIMPEIDNTFFANLANGINDIAAMYHYDILLATIDSNHNNDIAVFNSLLAKQVDGIVYIGYYLSEALYQEFTRSRTPIVLAGTRDQRHTIPSVNIDHFAATFDAVSMLAAHNEKVALVCGPLTEFINSHEYLEGYKKALSEDNRTYSEGLVFESQYTLESGKKLAARLLASGATAAFITDDLLAVGVVNELIDKGHHIPDDLEIVSANNTIYTEIVRPRLTSIEHPLYDIGAVAMRLLTKMINDDEIEESEILLPYSLVMKESSK